jgi:hypothetical protein
MFVLGSYQSLALAAPSEQPAKKTQVATESSEEEPSRPAAADDGAQQLMGEAKGRYREGDLRGAIELLQQCYELTHDASVLFNIAQVYRELDDCGAAVKHYELYVQHAPEGKRVADADKHLKDLVQRCKAKPATVSPAQPSAPPPPPPPPPPPSPQSTSEPTNYWPLIAGVSFGASVISAVATTSFAIQANHAKNDVERIQTQPHFDARTLNTRFDDFYRDRNWAVGMGIAFGVTAGIGTYALTAAARVKNEHLRGVSVVVTPRGTSVGFQLRF